MICYRSQLTTLRDLNESRIRELKGVGEYDVNYLIRGAMRFFHILTDMMFFRSVYVWPDKIEDKETLSRMYSVVYGKIAEIQTELLRFLKSIKIGMWPGIDPKWFVRVSKDPTINENLSRYLSGYQILGMQSEIQNLIDSVSKLNNEIKHFDYFDLHKIESLEDLYEEGKKLTRNLQNIDKILAKMDSK